MEVNNLSGIKFKVMIIKMDNSIKNAIETIKGPVRSKKFNL